MEIKNNLQAINSKVDAAENQSNNMEQLTSVSPRSGTSSRSLDSQLGIT